MPTSNTPPVRLLIERELRELVQMDTDALVMPRAHSIC